MTAAGQPTDMSVLRHSYELLLKAQSLGRTGYVISDHETGHVYWSDSLFEQRKEPPRPHFTREEALAFIHPEDRPTFEAARKAAARTGEPFRLSWRIVCRDGTVIWEEGIGQTQFDQNGRDTGFLVVVRDVTESLHTSAMLKSQEAIYRTLFDGIGDAILLTDAGNVVDCNAAAIRLFGCPREMIVGKSPVYFSPESQPDGRASSEGAAERIEAALSGERQQFEWRHKRADGAEFDAEVTLSRVDLPGQSLLFGVVRDISARRAATEALRIAHKKFLGVFEASPDAMLLVRHAGPNSVAEIIEVNRPAETLFRLPRNLVIGKSISEIAVNIDRTQLAETRQRVMRGIGIQNGEILISRPDGSKRYLELNSAPLELDGKPHTVFIVRDITEKHEAEQRIRDLNESLNASIRQLRDIADNLPVLVTYQDQDGRFRFLNKTAQQWLGKSESELVGRTVPETMPAEYLAVTEEVRNRRAQGPLHLELRTRFPDGVTRSVDVTHIPDLGEDCEVRGYYTLAVDVTARKVAETELRAARDKFAGAFNTSPDAMLVLAFSPTLGEGRIVEVNEAATRLFGMRRGDLVGATIRETELIADWGQVEAFREHFSATSVVLNFPLQLVRRGGVHIDVEASGSRFELDEVNHDLLVLHDVTDRRAAERKIRELNATVDANYRQLRSIADNLPVLISSQDAEGRFNFVNRVAQEWLGRPEAELIGRTVADTMPPEYLEVARSVRQLRDSGQSDIEATLTFPDGKVRTIAATYISDVDENGELRGYHTLTTDITERRATEERLRQSQKMEAIGQLTGGVAHDFNNLLAIILGNLELASARLRADDAGVARLLAPALRAAERGATLTQSLLAFARRQTLSPTVVNVSTLVRDMTDLLRRTLPANVEIEFVGGAGLWKCEADEGQLQNAVLNLVVNARDAMPDGGKLTIETSNARLDEEYASAHQEVKAGQYVLIAVSDTGTGMSRETIARIFEPFFTTKGPNRGTGLGLSMVYGFVKQSRGHVAAYSEVGHGTTMRIYLPRWVGKSERTSTPGIRISETNDETILIVEDDEDVRIVTVTMLRSLGYKVLQAGSGAAALETLRTTPEVALVVTDVVLSGDMNGRRVADEALKLNPRIGILYMSGYTADAIVHHGRLDPGVNFVQKPFRRNDLAVKVRAALDGTEA